VGGSRAEQEHECARIEALAFGTQYFDGAEFPFAFLAAVGNNETTIKRLRKASAPDRARRVSRLEEAA
jgi:hypothetical protein